MKTDVKNARLLGPFESFRDYISALEARGKLVRIPEMDQDRYQSTAFAYRLLDSWGLERAPAFLIERVKIDGRWLEGPVIGNAYGGWEVDSMVFGVEKIGEDRPKTFKAVIDTLFSHLDEGGQWKRQKPVAVDRRDAPCKEVIVTGEDIDVLQYPWLKNNPADGGRYINTPAVFVEDPKLGRNCGVYRCQVKGKTRIAVNATAGQHGGMILRAMKRRGEKIAHVALALGVDPIIWSLSASKLTGFGEDELEVAGELMGKPIKVVRCETSDLMVPANAEMIIEGDIPLDEGIEEGPYGEMYGYLGGSKTDCFYMDVKAVTHRSNPWFFNSYTGVAPDMIMAPVLASHQWRLRKLIPNLVSIYQFDEASGVMVASIDKKFAGEGMQAGQYIAAGQTVKIAIVVDKDINILDPAAVMHAMAARWQPSASLIVPQSRFTMPDPSAPKRGLNGKMVIDATQQWPQEGGPASWPPLNRALLEDHCPGLMDEVDEKWSKHWRQR